MRKTLADLAHEFEDLSLRYKKDYSGYTKNYPKKPKEPFPIKKGLTFLAVSGIVASSVYFFTWNDEKGKIAEREIPAANSPAITPRTPRTSPRTYVPRAVDNKPKPVTPTPKPVTSAPKPQMTYQSPSRTRQQTRQQVTRSADMNYFNREYQKVIELTRQGKYKEADDLASKLQREIWAARDKEPISNNISYTLSQDKFNFAMA